MNDPISSPCTKVCVIDDSTGLCEGCGRSLTEIGDWSGLDEQARLAVMAKLPARMAQRAARKTQSRETA